MQALQMYEHLEKDPGSSALCYPQIAACHRALGNLVQAETLYQQIWEGRLICHGPAISGVAAREHRAWPPVLHVARKGPAS